MNKVSGGCHCGNIQIEAELTCAPEACRPRACDCDFCRMHAAAWLSDPDGSLLIHIKDAHESGTYHQGSGRAEFLLCRKCGVLVGVLHRTDQRLYAAVNAKALREAAQFGADQTVSPRTLSADEKIDRWRRVWFRHVDLRTE